MQSNDVKAFRQRLSRNGFTDISIYDCGDGCFSVNCTSRDGVRIRRKMTVTQMNATPRVVWFD